MKKTRINRYNLRLRTFEVMYEKLVENLIATEDEISLVCSINGSSIDTLNSILYSKTGYRTWEQYYNMEIIDNEIIYRR